MNCSSKFLQGIDRLIIKIGFFVLLVGLLSGCSNLPKTAVKDFAHDISIMTSPDVQSMIIKTYSNFLSTEVLTEIGNYNAGIVEGREGYLTTYYEQFGKDDNGCDCYVLYGYRNATTDYSNFVLTRVYFNKKEITAYDVTFYYPYNK